MGFTPQQRLDALRITYDALFSQVFEDTPTWYSKVCSIVSSKAKGNVYGWIMNQFAMREWVGPRIVQNISEHKYELSNKLWEMTAQLQREDFEDDNLNVFAQFVMPNLAEAAKKHPDILVAQTIQANGLAFDGLSFFNDAHPNYNTTGTGATTYDNDGTNTLDGPGVTATRSAMASYIGENGYPLNVIGSLLIVPPQLEVAADTIAKSVTYAIPTGGGAIGPTTAMATVDNVLKGKFDVLMIPELANQPTTWYLADVSKKAKPFLFQPRIEPELVARFNPQDPAVFDLDQFIWGCRARYNAGYVLPYLCYRNTF